MSGQTGRRYRPQGANGKHCFVCSAPLTGRQTRYCSDPCYRRMHSGRLSVSRQEDAAKHEPPPTAEDDPAFIAAWGLRDYDMADFDRQVR